MDFPLCRDVLSEYLESEVYNLATAICVIPQDAIVMGKIATRHTYNQIGALNLDSSIFYHTLGTNIRYGDDERDFMFIRDREERGFVARAAEQRS